MIGELLFNKNSAKQATTTQAIGGNYKMYKLISVFLILIMGCTAAPSNEDQIQQSQTKMNKTKFDNFHIDTAFLESISEFPLTVEEKLVF
ncbi:hypothetical protein [Pontibacter rugosus]|uniref:Uncharacterized protein n=1 Tax=Pontibacter rugosus TaxID=1745966 RepID=A0ABW3SR66_9BACT